MADTDVRESKSESSLELAIKSKDIELVKTVIKAGADVNGHNADGDTPLHIAIAQDADYECLRLLMENGAKASATNKFGLKPLHMLNSESIMFSLLKLEKYIDARDYYGNTVMHFLMMTYTSKEIYEKILLEFSDLNIDFNAQNEFGQTPLHLAAYRIAGMDSIDFVLSHFDDVNILLKDKRGDTFFHCLLEANTAAANSDLHTFCHNILDSKFKSCSPKVSQKLLQTKNNTGHTPFQILFKILDYHDNVDIFGKFLESGADVNSCNMSGETVLHNFDMETLEVVEYIIRKGANVNAQNVFLETPIFQTNNVEFVKLLLENGADVGIRNKVGKTPLMAKVLEDIVEEDVIELLIEHGADVNAVDIHGSSCLHYAAWKNVASEIVHFLKESGAKSTQDKMGKFPCFIAEYLGHFELMAELCQCEPDSHRRRMFSYKKVIKLEEIKERPFMKGTAVGGNLSGIEMPYLMDLPLSGSVEFNEEAGELKTAVTKAVEDICKAIGEADDLFCNSVFQSGSVREKTKVGLPDEFDFVCLINFIAQVCEVDEEKSIDDIGYAYVKLKEEFRDKPCRQVFDEYCYLESDEIFRRFLRNLKQVVKNTEFYTHPNLIFAFESFREAPMVPNCQFVLRWTGSVYKDIKIDIDLVPACQVKAWWPPDTNFGSVVGDVEKLRNDGALLLLQMTVDEDYEPEAKLRISAQSAEKLHMAALPQVARDAYMVSKMMCSDKICPKVIISEEPLPSYLKTFLTSYMLKNCMFHVINENFVEMTNTLGEQPMNYKTSIKYQRTVLDCVIKIFHQLISYTETENLPSFVFPWQNIFTFQDFTEYETLDVNKRNCLCRRIYAKLILNILGEDVDFKDLDISKVTASPL